MTKYKVKFKDLITNKTETVFVDSWSSETAREKVEVQNGNDIEILECVEDLPTWGNSFTGKLVKKLWWVILPIIAYLYIKSKH